MHRSRAPFPAGRATALTCLLLPSDSLQATEGVGSGLRVWARSSVKSLVSRGSALEGHTPTPLPGIAVERVWGETGRALSMLQVCWSLC